MDTMGIDTVKLITESVYSAIGTVWLQFSMHIFDWALDYLRISLSQGHTASGTDRFGEIHRQQAHNS